jgi:hypothetical protein
MSRAFLAMLRAVYDGGSRSAQTLELLIPLCLDQMEILEAGVYYQEFCRLFPRRRKIGPWSIHDIRRAIMAFESTPGLKPLRPELLHPPRRNPGGVTPASPRREPPTRSERRSKAATRPAPWDTPVFRRRDRAAVQPTAPRAPTVIRRAAGTDPSRILWKSECVTSW